ncbi:MAG: serine/threonine-protein kinase [Acetobacteraceae bacterium]
MTNAGQPRQIGRYHVVSVIGAGSMGVVYRAHDPAIGRDVAIKVVRIDANSRSERVAAVERLRIEARAAGRCRHPGIIGVYDFVEQDSEPAIVMEFVEGRSLYAHMRDGAARARLEPVPLARQILVALAYAHGQGIIHRDIKPANILLDDSGATKIADFGIARVQGTNVTLSGSALGTPNYMAPEQLDAGQVDQRADLFSVGAVLYELLAGRPPFAGTTTTETLGKLAGPLEADVRPVPLAFRPVLERALAKERTRRFRSAEEFVAALASDTLGSVPAAPPDAATLVMPSSGGAFGSLLDVWEPALLRTVERELAKFLGPMARVLVTRAAREAVAPDEMFVALAAHLTEPSDRSLFLRAVRADPSLGSRTGARGPGSSAASSSGGRASGGASGSGSSGTGVRTGALPPGRPFAGVPDVAAAAAQAVLAQYVGPMARLFVREAAAASISPRDFIERLCVQVPKPEEQAALRKRLAAEVEPKLG